MVRITLPRPMAVLRKIREAFSGTFHSPVYVVVGALLTVLVYGLFALSTFPAYTVQLLSADVAYIGEALGTLTANLYASIGAFGLGVMVLYSFLTAVVILHLVIQFRTAGVKEAMAGAGGAAPAFLIGGCAGCGAGLLGLVGAAGAIGLLPFQGNGIRVLGVLLLLGLLAYAGDPRTCSLDR